MIPRAESAGSRPHICLCKFDTILSWEKSPSFVGAVVSQKRHTILEKDRNIGLFWIMRLRLGTALAGMALSVAVCAALWPHARDAGASLAAQDDPAALSDIQINSALRSNQALVAQNIEAALAEGDSDLAHSFLQLARDKGIAVSDELSKRVTDAVAEAGTASHFAKRFATGLVTGKVEDVRSEEHTSELQSLRHLVCRLLLEK